ncbi:MAG: hypothetical protein IPK07_34395 [Deltaproteobacteria bacterium]|nr:hypothetical protein [Deltaproteobacteria bacterium]
MAPTIEPHPPEAPPEAWEEALGDGTVPVTLGPAYLAAIARVEALPENGNGADKSWVVRAMRRARERRAKVVRVR